MQIELKILDQRLGKEFPTPTYQTSGATAFDLRSMLQSEHTLLPNERVLVPTGIAIHIQNPAFAGFVYPRSGLGHKHGIILGNAVGVIDSDYQGEIKLSLHNTSQVAYTLGMGQRVAQLAIMPVVQAQFIVVGTFGEQSERGEGGFGHTGTQ